MATLPTIVLALAMVGAWGFSIYRVFFSRNWRRFLLESTALLVFGAVVNAVFNFPYASNGVVPKGDESDWTVIAVLFFFVVLGAFANALYDHFSLPLSRRRNRKLDWGPFFASLCVS